MPTSMQIFRRALESQRRRDLHNYLVRQNIAKAESLDKLRQLYAEADRDLHRDLDGDGITDVEERAMGTNPHSIDSDWDGYTDLKEVSQGSNPRINESELEQERYL